jgi:clan AA aspartic protease (TIGR02281 family)
LHVARRVAGTAAALAALLSAPVHAEIYQWTDAQGRVHFTEHLDRVPPAQRDAAMRGKRAESSGSLQIIPSASAPASAEPETASRAPARSASGGRKIQIPFQPYGTLMRVHVRLNDTLDAPFFIDTGASGVSLPASVADRLGIRVTRDTPRAMVYTANGAVSLPRVRLDSIQLGGARVEGLEAMLNPSMDIGLLGGTFFNNYVYSVDHDASVITLEPNDKMRGGYNAERWRARFQELMDPLKRLEAHLGAPDAKIDPGERRFLERRLAELREQLDLLEDEADSQGVPEAWRQL